MSVTGRKPKPSRPREVVGGKTSAEVLASMQPPRGQIEVRERRDGTWRVWYPDEGYIPCPPVCELKHSHDYKQKMVESFYHPTSREDAKLWAAALAEEREVKVFRYGAKKED